MYPWSFRLRVDRGGPDRNLGVMTVEIRDSHLGREQTDKTQIARTMLLQTIDGCDGGVAVASIGSTAITSRSARSVGALK